MFALVDTRLKVLGFYDLYKHGRGYLGAHQDWYHVLWLCPAVLGTYDLCKHGHGCPQHTNGFVYWCGLPHGVGSLRSMQIWSWLP